MKIRIFQIYDKFGVNSEEALQCWDEDSQRWIDVPYVRCRDIDEEEALTTENY